MNIEIVAERPAAHSGRSTGKYREIREAVLRTLGTTESVRVPIADLSSGFTKCPQAYLCIPTARVCARRVNGSLYLWAEPKESA